MPAAQSQRTYLTYVGTYTGDNGSRGIYAFRFSPDTGRLEPLGLAAETPSPSFLALHPSGRFLYAVNEHDPTRAANAEDTVSAFALEAGGHLRLLNKVSSRGQGPCHLAVDRSGHALLVANYQSGSVAALPIAPDGRLGDAAAVDQHRGSSVNPARQAGPHAHFIEPSPDGRFALSADLGLDQVLVYRFNASPVSLTPNDPPFARLAGGAGPRHLAFHPNGRFAYVNAEMASTVTAFAYDASRGVLRELQTISTVPAGFTGDNSTAEIQTSRDGRHLYVSNRGHDSIAVFSIDPATGRLGLAGHTASGGKTPRSFSLDPTGKYLFAANQNSNTLVLHRVDPQTGLLSPLSTRAAISQPVSIVFVPE